jgi:hypothetical protein
MFGEVDQRAADQKQSEEDEQIYVMDDCVGLIVEYLIIIVPLINVEEGTT